MTNYSSPPNVLLIDATRDKLHLELIHHGPTGVGDADNCASTKTLPGVIHEVSFQYLNEILLKEIRAFLHQHSMVLSDIGMLAVNHGPGAYNGIRISVVVAKTIAFFHRIPIYTFDGFMVMDAWRQTLTYKNFLERQLTSHGPRREKFLNVMVLNPNRNIFFLVLYVDKNNKSTRLGKIIPFTKTSLIRDWLTAKTVGTNFFFQIITDVFKLTKDECSLLPPVSTEATKVEPQSLTRWFFFDKTSYQNFVAFIGQEQEGQLVQERIIWDDVFQHDDAGSLFPKKVVCPYQAVIKMAMETSTGEVMEVTPHYYRNFGE